MSTRRSRLSVKPNVSRKTATPAGKILENQKEGNISDSCDNKIKQASKASHSKNILDKETELDGIKHEQTSADTSNPSKKVSMAEAKENATSATITRRRKGLIKVSAGALSNKKDAGNDLPDDTLKDTATMKTSINRKSSTTSQQQNSVPLTNNSIPTTKSTRQETTDKEEVKPVRRARLIKAKPNLGDVSRQRKRQASVGTSDSEDERKATHPPNIVMPANTHNSNTVKQAPAATSPVKAKALDGIAVLPPADECTSAALEAEVDIDTTSTGVRKMSEKHPEAPPPRKRYMVDPELRTGTIDRSRVTMKDLIYLNPKSNPMKAAAETSEKQKKQKAKETLDNGGEATMVAAGKSPQPGNPQLGLSLEDAETAGDDEDSMPIPQLKVGPDGSIILNEDSLRVTEKDPEDLTDHTETVVENDNLSTYVSFRKNYQKPRTWGELETKKFYLALSCVGTDFAMLKQLFPKRSRHELKVKYKKEDKLNKHIIDKCLGQDQQFDMAFFQKLKDLDVEEADLHQRQERKHERLQARKEAQAQLQSDKKQKPRKPKKQRRKKDVYYDHSDEEGEKEPAASSTVAEEVAVSSANDQQHAPQLPAAASTLPVPGATTLHVLQLVGGSGEDGEMILNQVVVEEGSPLKSHSGSTVSSDIHELCLQTATDASTLQINIETELQEPATSTDPEDCQVKVETQLAPISKEDSSSVAQSTDSGYLFKSEDVIKEKEGIKHKHSMQTVENDTLFKRDEQEEKMALKNVNNSIEAKNEFDTQGHEPKSNVILLVPANIYEDKNTNSST